MQIKTLENTLIESWDEKTCHPNTSAMWTGKNPALGQCAVTALVVQDYLGGQLARSETLAHVWNILQDGSEVDLSRSQFPNGLKIEKEYIILREEVLYGNRGKKAKVAERYELLKERVSKKLGESNSE